jgi:hypothetical protein
VQPDTHAPDRQSLMQQPGRALCGCCDSTAATGHCRMPMPCASCVLSGWCARGCVVCGIHLAGAIHATYSRVPAPRLPCPSVWFANFNPFRSAHTESHARRPGHQAARPEAAQAGPHHLGAAHACMVGTQPLRQRAPWRPRARCFESTYTAARQGTAYPDCVPHAQASKGKGGQQQGRGARQVGIAASRITHRDDPLWAPNGARRALLDDVADEEDLLLRAFEFFDRVRQGQQGACL